MEQESTSRRTPPDSSESSIGNRLDALSSAHAERVLKRAIELQSDSEFADPTLDPPALERVAAELGIDVGYVRQALLEELSRPESPASSSWTDRVFAPHSMSARFVVQGTRPEVDTTIDAWMTKHEGLRPTRRSEDGMAWVKNASPINSIRQGLKISQGTGALRTVRQVTHRVDSISDTQHVVSLDADTAHMTHLGVGLSAGGIVGAAATGAVLGFTGALGALGAVAIALTVLVTFLIAAVLSVKIWLVQVDRGLERATDGIAHTDLITPEESVPRKIARFVDELRDLRKDLR